MSNFHVAIVGCGGLGRTHAECISDIDGLTTEAYCDVALTQAERLFIDFGGAYATDSLDQILEDESINVVYVTTQHDSHADITIRALAAGKHVMLEKPLALTMSECLRVRDAALNASGKLMIAFKMRYFDMVIQAKKLVPEPLIVSMQMMDNRWEDTSWTNDPIKGGGNVLSQGCHATDLIRFVVGRDPIEVYASGANFYQSTGVVDNIAAVFRFDNNVTANWIQGDADTPPHTSKFFLQMFAEGRSVTLSQRLTTLTYHETGKDPQVFRGSETGFREESVELLHALREDTPPPIDVIDGVYATAMTLQAVTAAKTHAIQPIRAAIEHAIPQG